MKNIAIFASGSGTNAENLIRFFRTSPYGRIKLVLTNNPDAYVLKRAQSYDIETVVFSREQLNKTGEVLAILEDKGIDFIVLAGFLWLIPNSILQKFERKIVNIHPALLPKFGGKGMYGKHVHETVIASGETVSGISIHHVNQKYDEGNIIFQATCEVKKDDNPESLAKRIHTLEYEHYPKVVEELLNHL
jgi:phosphoribosylglycinamide formyltransferase-1